MNIQKLLDWNINESSVNISGTVFKEYLLDLPRISSAV